MEGPGGDRVITTRLTTARLVIESSTPGHEWTRWTVTAATSGEPIGELGVRLEAEEPTAEIRVTVAAAVRGKGFGTEAVGRLVEHLLDGPDTARVVAVVAQADEHLHRLLGRAGLEPVALDGDDVIFSRLRR